MPKLLARTLARYRPQEGWVPLLLTLTAIFCLPLLLIQDSQDLEGASLLVLTALAAAGGLGAARSKMSAKVTAGLSLVLGAGLVVILVGSVLPPLSLLWHDISTAPGRLSQSLSGDSPGPLPSFLGMQYSAKQLSILGTRIWGWTQTLGNTDPVQDAIILVLLAAFLTWSLAFFAMWQVYRRRSVLIGLLPGGATIATVAFFSGGISLFYLVVHLLCTLSLLGVTRLVQQRERWDRAGTDYQEDLGVELTLVLAPTLLVILALAILFPVVHPRQIRDAFWRIMDAPWSAAEQASERLFGPMAKIRGGFNDSPGSLPRGHLLGGAPELAETIAFFVSTDDPPPPLPGPAGAQPSSLGGPRRYWRSTTYDTYTGLGWTNGPSQNTTLAPDQPLFPELPPGQDLLQRFELADSQVHILYAANTPLRIDHPVEAVWRAPGDLVHLSGDALQYTVMSRPPQPTAAELSMALPLLPPGPPDRYLALPESVPQRVIDLAAEVTGDAESHYDKALAIEFFLRTYTYTLDLPSPPGNRDLVDYFLFDQQAGYCDYYASAMVVMARAVGVPARFAAGYAQGEYDHNAGRWAVVEKDGHSWVEVYFDGLGWVEFEPTAGQPALVRTGGESKAPVVPELPARIPGKPGSIWGLLVLVGLLVLLGAVVVRIWRRGRGRADAATELVQDRQERLIRWGTRMGQPFRDGLTPLEYSSDLGQMLRERGQASPWKPVQAAGDEAPTEVDGLTRKFVRAQYGPEPVTDRDSWVVRELWIRLRRHLWWLWLGRR